MEQTMCSKCSLFEVFNVAVSNLSRDVSDADLRGAFSHIGPIVATKMRHKKCSGIISFGNKRAQRAAAVKMSNKELFGRKVQVRVVDHLCCPNCQQEEKWWTLAFDGASRGNPGEGGAGAVLYDWDGTKYEEESEYLGGEVTNNEAEYHALISGLKMALQHDVEQLEIVGDSEVVIKQLQGRYKVRSGRLRALHWEVRELCKRFGKVLFFWVPREENTDADRLANEALDGELV